MTPAWVTDAHGVIPAVSSWRSGDLLADAIPIAGGRLTARLDSNVKQTVYINVPRTTETMPLTDDHPLSHYGQTLMIGQTITYGGETLSLPLGTYLIMGHDIYGDFIEIEAVSLEQLLLEYRMTTPRQPPGNATFDSEIRALVSGTVPYVADAELSDRSLPAGISTDWVEDRWQAIADVMTAWPAEPFVTRNGVFTARPVSVVDADNVQREWVHGTHNAYVQWSTSGVRDKIYNAVVARGTNADGVDVWAMAKAESGPTRYGGPFGRKQRFYYSPLLTTTAQCTAAARSILRQELRRTMTLEVEAPPDPTLELGMTGAVTDETGARYVGVVAAYSLPLHAGGGPMSVTLGEVT